MAQLGTVEEILAPNAFHDLFLEEWLSAVPEARLWIPPRMNRDSLRRSGTEVLRESSRGNLWQEELACVPIKGLPQVDEFAIYHNASKSLVVADLLFNIQPGAKLATRVAAWLGGYYRRLAIPRDMRLWYLRDRVAFEQSVQRILDFPFENIVIGHGANTIGNGRLRFTQAFRWLLAESESNVTKPPA